MALPCTSTRSWPATHRTPSVIVPPGWCRMAFVTRSLVSRTATSGSTGARQRSRAARTWRRASATVAGPAVSRTGSPGSSVGRGGAIVVMGGPLAGDGPGRRRLLGRGAAPVPGCTTNAAASCSERHRSADVYRTGWPVVRFGRAGGQLPGPHPLDQRGQRRAGGRGGPAVEPGRADAVHAAQPGADRRVLRRLLVRVRTAGPTVRSESGHGG